MNPYASERPTGYPSREDLSGTIDACAICRADGVPISEEGWCAECAPKEEESCAEWLYRMRPRRRSLCCCTARFDAPDVYASGYCKAHGVAWHVRRNS